MTSPQILCINGSLRGRRGNTGRVIDYARHHAQGRARMPELLFADLDTSVSMVEGYLRGADAFLFCSGVYWNSFGSPMQRFLEVATQWETTDVFVGKAVGVVLTMDSVGGMEVANRLHGVLNLFGCMSPPLSTVVLSRIGQMATQQAPQQDVYSVTDVGLLVDNLMTAATMPRPAWRTWPVKPTLPPRDRYEAPGLLEIDHDPWVATDAR